MTESLLKNLRQARHKGWRSLLRGDESWFSYATDYERMWFPEGAISQSRPSTIISTPRVMVSIFACPLGFPVITRLPPRTKFTAAYFCGDIIPKVIEGMPFDLATSTRQLMVHMANATRDPAWGSITCLKRF
jgi:hypothetical protein